MLAAFEKVLRIRLEHYRTTFTRLTVDGVLARKAGYPPRCGSLSG